MRKPAKLITASAVAILLGSLSIAPQVVIAADKKPTAAELGKKSR
jgi:hypothetical protein